MSGYSAILLEETANVVAGSYIPVPECCIFCDIRRSSSKRTMTSYCGRFNERKNLLKV
jgi:hypothetical protein